MITNGHTTSCDLLWSGCPMITFPATVNMPSRVAASICQAVGCPEMIATDAIHYESLAVELACDKSKLRALRKKVERCRLTEPLFDTERWVSDMEKGLLMAWRLFCTSGTKQHIEVPQS